MRIKNIHLKNYKRFDGVVTPSNREGGFPAPGGGLL